MSIKTTLFAAILASGLLIGAVVDTPFVRAATTDAPPMGPSCYPDNEWVIAKQGSAGPLWAVSSGSGIITDGEIEIPPDDSSMEPIAGLVQWQFRGRVTGNYGGDLTQAPGAMGGYLWVQITWDDPDLPVTTFQSDCVAELQLDEGKIETELEGWVNRFPYERPESRYAVATMNVLPSEDNPGGLNFHFGLEFGRTCFEELVVPDGSLNEFEITVKSDHRGNGTMRVSDPSPSREFGRAALPWGYPRANYPDPFGGPDTWKSNREPCPAVFF